jgi:TonB family protein
LGVHLVLIFGFLVSPAGKEAITEANRSVAVLLRPAPKSPLNATADAAAHQHGGTAPRDGLAQALQVAPAQPRTPPLSQEAPGSVTRASTALTVHQTPALIAARATLEADYISQWQIAVERFGNAHYRDTAKRYGSGDVRLRVRVGSNGALRDIRLLSTSGVTALDRTAIETVERLAPFDAFPPALANSVAELDIIRTWQFRY